MDLSALRKTIFLLAVKMKSAKLLFMGLFLWCPAIVATKVVTPTETHFETSCVIVGGFCIPQKTWDQYRNFDYEDDVLVLPNTTKMNPKVDPKDIITNFCKSNEVDKLIIFYQEWQKDRSCSELLKIIMFPDRILDVTPYASCVEENNATKLAILLSAAAGNAEAQVLALDILLSLTARDSAIALVEKIKKSLQTRFSRIDPKHRNVSDLLGLFTVPSLDFSETIVTERIKTWEAHREQLKQNSMFEHS